VTPLARLLPADPPLTPSGDEGRSWLRRELLHPEYHRRNLVEDAVAWLQRQVDRGVEAASHAPPLSTFAAMVVFLLLVGGLVWLVSRTSRSVRRPQAPGPVLGEDVPSAGELRARAELALSEGRTEDALVDAFRAVAVRQAERGRLDDAPGATAHEVAGALVAAYPDQRAAVETCARLFDEVRYGDRRATREQAAAVLWLDDALMVLR
jgi:hypothetical protein